MESKIDTLAKILKDSMRAVFFGGAGMSTESGIPDFRSADGIYNQNLHLINKTETKADVRAELVIREPIGKTGASQYQL